MLRVDFYSFKRTDAVIVIRGSSASDHITCEGADSWLFVGPKQAKSAGIPRKIVDFHVDEDGEWVAELECGHKTTNRHNSPWMINPWVTTPQLRLDPLGRTLGYIVCYLTRPAAFVGVIIILIGLALSAFAIYLVDGRDEPHFRNH